MSQYNYEFIFNSFFKEKAHSAELAKWAFKYEKFIVTIFS